MSCCTGNEYSRRARNWKPLLKLAQTIEKFRFSHQEAQTQGLWPQSQDVRAPALLYGGESLGFSSLCIFILGP